MKRRAGFGLIEVLIVVVIIGILAAVLVPRLTGGGRDAAGRTVASPKQRAEQTAGASHTSQINLAIQMYQQEHDGQNPPNLEALKNYGVTDEMLRDPVTRQPLAYDPQTGKIGGEPLPQTPGF